MRYFLQKKQKVAVNTIKGGDYGKSFYGIHGA
jgi:hypothetical protein